MINRHGCWAKFLGIILGIQEEGNLKEETLTRTQVSLTGVG